MFLPDKPLVLILDDLHWSDKPSLLFLEFLTRELAPAAIFISGLLTSPSRRSIRYTVDSDTEKPLWSVIHVANCLLLRSVYSMATCNTTDASPGVNAFQVLMPDDRSSQVPCRCLALQR